MLYGPGSGDSVAEGPGVIVGIGPIGDGLDVLIEEDGVGRAAAQAPTGVVGPGVFGIVCFAPVQHGFTSAIIFSQFQIDFIRGGQVKGGEGVPIIHREQILPAISRISQPDISHTITCAHGAKAADQNIVDPQGFIGSAAVVDIP